MVVELVDSTGTIIKDANGVNNTFTLDLTTLTTQYAAYNGVFRTPIVLPASQKIRLRQTTALTTGRSIYLDKLAMSVMNQLAPSEIFLSIFAGSIPFATNDYVFITKTKTSNSGEIIDTFQTLFVRLFPTMLSNEFILPSATGGSQTVQDTLIS